MLQIGTKNTHTHTADIMYELNVDTYIKIDVADFMDIYRR